MSFKLAKKLKKKKPNSSSAPPIKKLFGVRIREKHAESHPRSPNSAFCPPLVLVAATRENTVQCFACLFFVFTVDLTCFIVENVRSLLLHMYVFPNLERIFSAKSFSLGNLFLLINFQKLFTVSNTVSIAAYLFNKKCYACSFFYCTVIEIGYCRDGQLI